MKLWIIAAIASFCATPLLADPCGMVPPMYVGDDVPIAREGDQKTYVFFKDGIETCVIHPGFQGKVDEFGMLIPFPTVPAIRKVPDHLFMHVSNAIDPPEVVVDIHLERLGRLRRSNSSRSTVDRISDYELAFRMQRDAVRVVREEAVGMYEVAVLEAGSSAALKAWMNQHGYKYPKGMDVACNDYVETGWCFVAVKAKIGQKEGVDPKPGMRKAHANLPSGSTFDGHVQAMGFRFRVKELVVPMRLSTFNEGDLHNIAYILTDGPKKIRSIPEEYVVRQIPGEQLIKNVTQPLPLRLIGGTAKDLQPYRKMNLKTQRDPAPKNGAAKELFAADLKSVDENRLSHPHEESEKMLLRIGERLGLRGPDIDRQNEAALADARKRDVDDALGSLQALTLTVVDGNFPREVLATRNLTFADYAMPHRRNSAEHYDAKTTKPAAKRQGTLVIDTVSSTNEASSANTVAETSLPWMTWAMAVVIIVGISSRFRPGFVTPSFDGHTRRGN